jgi:hypothetical protein
MDRSLLAARLKALDPSGKGEAIRMEQLELKPAAWIAAGRGEALGYASVYFTLVSNARQDIVRRAALRLEQIYTAFARFLPAKCQGAKPTTIVLVRSLAEYQAILKEKGRTILNPAFYDPEGNQVLCACDLEELGDELERIRQQHQQQLDDLRKLEADLNKQYKGRIPPGILDEIASRRQKIKNTNAKNDKVFQTATRQLFRTLYHEAFHAYLGTFVYPPAKADVPRWLNEGLAQIFETAIVEAGELRVGHADPDRLGRTKAAARTDRLVPLADLLRAGPKQFLVAHASDQQVSDRYYVNSWALAFYLTFDRRLLGTTALDHYVQSLKQGTDPVKAFEELVQVPLSDFEADFSRYLLQLRENGSIAAPPSGK